MEVVQVGYYKTNQQDIGGNAHNPADDVGALHTGKARVGGGNGNPNQHGPVDADARQHHLDYGATVFSWMGIYKIPK